MNPKREARHRKGVLWIYGDSVAKTFAEHLVTGPYQETCVNRFKQCKVTYSWIYNTKNLEIEEKLDGKDYDHEKVLAEINKVNKMLENRNNIHCSLQLSKTVCLHVRGRSYEGGDPESLTFIWSKRCNSFKTG